MKKMFKLIAAKLWWVVARLEQVDKYDRDYDWRTIRGWLIAPISRRGYVIGWSCWLILLAGVGTLLWWLLGAD